MFSPKKILEISSKSKFMLLRTNSGSRLYPFTKSTAPSKGHFVFYTTDGERYEIPLRFLSNLVVKELLKKAEEEFGLPRDGPIMVPCDSQLMNYIMSFIQKQASSEVASLLVTLAAGCISRSCLLHRDQDFEKLPIFGC